MLTTVVDARGQVSKGELFRAHWPDVLYETQAGVMNRPGAAAAEDFSETEVLPFVDTLALSYRGTVIDGRPIIDFELRWVLGDGGILDGRLVPQMPDSVVLNLIDLHADVRVAGEKVGDLVLALDSLVLPPGDFQYTFSTDSDWTGVFEEMDADQARTAFEEGFELDGLDILRVQFEAPPPQIEMEEEVLVVRRPPRRRTIFVPDVNIWIGWDLGANPYRGSRTRARNPNRRPRGETIGRTDGSSDERRTRGGRDNDEVADGSDSTGEETRATRSGKPDKGRSLPIPKTGNDNDDDDDRDFLGPALGAAAAVGALAYFGGTIGYFGYPSEAPVGIEAGRVTEDGGVLIHAAMSMNVFEGGQEQMVVGLAGAFKPLARVHPVVGIDVWFYEKGDSFEAIPVMTVGGLVRTGDFSLQAGLDLGRQRPRIGFAYSFR